MNRETKFRFWNKREKKMTRGLYLWEMKDIDFEFGDFTPLEFTGLKDKKGVEVFEGDIVKVLDRDWPSQLDSYPEMSNQQYLDFLSSYCEVIYSGDRFSLKQIKGKGYFTEDLSKNYGRDVFEVIGNIYENPNLFNEPKI